MRTCMRTRSFFVIMIENGGTKILMQRDSQQVPLERGGGGGVGGERASETDRQRETWKEKGREMERGDSGE